MVMFGIGLYSAVVGESKLGETLISVLFASVTFFQWDCFHLFGVIYTTLHFLMSWSVPFLCSLLISQEHSLNSKGCVAEFRMQVGVK